MSDLKEPKSSESLNELSLLYDENYYQNGCGIPYERNKHWLNFFGAIADEIIRSLNPQKVLDAGCAWGFLVESLWDRGVESWGIDISDYAIDKVRPDMKKYCSVRSLTQPIDSKFDLITCIEVLEHIPENDARKAVEILTNATETILFSSTPRDFDEPTHCNVRPIKYWLKLFSDFNFWPEINYNASFIAPHAILLRKSSTPISDEVLILFSEKIRHAMDVYDRDTEIGKYHHKINSQFTELSKDISDKNKEILALNEHINLQEERIEKRDILLSRKENYLTEKENLIDDLNSRLNLTKQALEAVLVSTSWRLTSPLRTIKKIGLFAKDCIRRRNKIYLHGSDYDSDSSKKETPLVNLVPEKEQYPNGWCLFSYKLTDKSVLNRVYIHVQVNNELIPQNWITLSGDNSEISKGVLCFPDKVNKIFLEMSNPDYHTKVHSIKLTEISKAEATARLIWYRLLPKLRNPVSFTKLLLQAVYVLRKEGFNGIKRSLLDWQNNHLAENDYNRWISKNDSLTDNDRGNIKDRINKMAESPTISVILPIYNPPIKFLKEAIESVLFQLYPNWELCIADDASTNKEIKKIIEEYRSLDDRIKVVYRETNGHISLASNSAIEIANGQYIALLDHDDLLAEHALYLIAETINKNPNSAIIYSDEDKIDDEGNRFSPYFKSEWNPDLFLAQNMINHLGVYRLDIVNQVGRFRVGFEGSQDYDLALRVTEVTEPEQIHHIPHILYHWRAIEGSIALNRNEKKYAHEKANNAIKEHLVRRNIKADVLSSPSGAYHRVKYHLPKTLPKVSFIIPTRDRPDLLEVCVNGILNETNYPNLEIIIVNNRSSDPDALVYLKNIDKNPKVSVLDYNKSFNYSAINNYAIEHVTGSLIVLLNNDIEVIDPEWLNEMVSHAIRAEIGAVGALLYYPDNTIQHAGVALGIGGVAGHLHINKPRGTTGYFGRAEISQNISAVTGACMVMRKEVFQKVGGLNADNLSVAFNDIDLCIRIREEGLKLIWTPFAELYHHESASRGSDQTADKVGRFNREIEYMKEAWGEILLTDPFYSPNLSLKNGNFTLADNPRTKKPWK
ncbi:MAG: glycosyl transferase, family 2 [Alphaproteobacteria bacterium]|mgnify:FL=1|nr:glycosyl transferase, family 2 [Alphaproteobacteria bacterium]PPR13654.1 MAG: Chondroitin synthase [Alphaproteobacteria bacterium MarineAlpha12_Bin1]|tara:strand:- start:6166 stop:9390 length:3225 start_codon:yes stop_codon:yes gene_type:complete